ncbi:MAG: hypothetical protein ACR2LX_13765 [Jatrophihabitans sp.]
MSALAPERSPATPVDVLSLVRSARRDADDPLGRFENEGGRVASASADADQFRAAARAETVR